MPRLYEIHSAFVAAIHDNPKGFQCLRTDDFIRQLAKVNWHFTRQDANNWIEQNQTFFVDKTPDDSQNKLWMLRNMGRVL
ncbi:hypothetical protein [Leclercia adecarboxylata]|uniref:hypothetical protein n=1 Tax=Leclercia adecarboxylata TaxID=83655 RepID=UPI0013CCAD10|nr:hypothetical protein [Leclercia adecarboxylata]NEG94328.1 hypothetical protein [Leclercia adecarboxylata]